MRYVIAVSGGVDSVALLDMAVNERFPNGLPKANEFIVAHFDHGIRPESADDAAFVEELAASYGLKFESKREELGIDASEELARTRRYAFLFELSKKYNAALMTAHHADDLIETIAINIIRGTGWRGLGVLNRPGILRPLLSINKQYIRGYADMYKLEWREDATNASGKYLRNKVRQRLESVDDQSRQLLTLYRDRQVVLAREVFLEAKRLVGTAPYSRHLFIMVPNTIAAELFQTVMKDEIGMSLTRPQLLRAVIAIKTFRSGKRYDIFPDVALRFNETEFVVER